MRTFDYSSLRTRQWDSEILGLVAQIHEHKGRQELYFRQKPAVLEKLIDIASVLCTLAMSINFSSTAGFCRRYSSCRPLCSWI